MFEHGLGVVWLSQLSHVPIGEGGLKKQWNRTARERVYEQSRAHSQGVSSPRSTVLVC